MSEDEIAKQAESWDADLDVIKHLLDNLAEQIGVNSGRSAYFLAMMLTSIGYQLGEIGMNEFKMVAKDNAAKGGES